MKAGKLPPHVLEGLLEKIPGHDPRLIIGARLGEDAAVINFSGDFGERYLVAKTDPITFAAERIGWYAVHINANDVATLGARPRWFLAALLLPAAELAQPILADILAACAELGVSLCGGHTELTAGLERPIVVGQMLGEVSKDHLVRKENIRPGDAILLTKGLAIEGTAILAREKAEALRGPLRSQAALERARNFLFDPGISVVAEALAAVEAAPGGVHGMHDPTEGGLVGGLYELAAAAGCGLRVERAAIPVLPETQAVCGALGLDPLRLIASGALLIAVAPEAAAAVSARTGAVRIGEVRPAAEGLRLDSEALTFPEEDEIARGLAGP